MFHIALKQVKDEAPVEEILIRQHKALKRNKIPPEQIKRVLEGQTESRVLLLIDGHDEYRTGINTSIDDAIKNESLNCWVVVTSRENEQLQDVKKYMDAEAEIHGFKKEQIQNYITRYLGDANKTKNLLIQTVKIGMCEEDPYENVDILLNCGICIVNFGILEIPLFLEMLCSLYGVNVTLPGSKAGLMEAIVQNSIRREMIRREMDKTEQELRVLLERLGKLAWTGLTEAGKKRLAFTKVIVVQAQITRAFNKFQKKCFAEIAERQSEIFSFSIALSRRR